jgi:2-polyprenyl-6-methoxyphenol hydroxylase-like FAD-dependent oxidoreductase
MSEPVVIAGGGPVGMMLACELGLAGVRSTVLERLDQPSDHSYGMAINATVVELLEQRGLMEVLEEDGFEFPQAHFAHLGLDLTKLPEKHPYNYAVPHSQLTRRLADRAAELGVEVSYGAEVVGLDQDGTGVDVTVRSGGELRRIRASYLVGCDGVTSAVRGLAQIGFPGVAQPFYGITGDVRVAPGDPILELVGRNQQPNGFLAVGPSGDGTFRVITGELDLEPADRQAPVTLAELHARIAQITGSDMRMTEGSAVWLSRWDADTRQADRYRAGRVFLAGDSAHVHFPFGGQGLSTGIEDAVNLGWKLAAQVHGWAPPGLLDSYQDERHPVGARACLTTRAQVALIHPMDRVTPLREIITELIQFDDVNEYLSRMVSGLDIRYSIDYPELPSGTPLHPLVGRRLHDAPLTTAAGETSVSRLSQTGRGLLLNLTKGEDLSGAVSGWADRVDVATADPTAEIGSPALLLRPDGRVAWAETAATAENAETDLPVALRAWFGSPS